MKVYPSYRDLQAGWISRTPSHWSAIPVKYVCTYNDDVLPENTASETQIQYIEISDVNPASGLRGGEVITFGEAPSRARRLVRDGDVIVSTVRTYLRAVAPISSPPENLVVSTGFAVIRPDGLAPGFARYALVADGFVGSVISRSTGVSYPAINASDLVRIPVPVPPIDEQLDIASYLDDETARIDGLIEAKVSLLGMLEEYRSSVIFELLEGAASHNPEGRNPELGWLRTVPSHWSVCGLGKRYEVQLGKMLDAKQITGKHLRPYLRNQDVQWWQINVENLPLMDFDADDQQKFSLQKGDVLVCEGGEVGRAAVWSSDFECFYQKAIHRLRPLTAQDEPEFVVLLLETAVKRGVFNIAEKSTIAHLPADQLRQHRFPFPPLSEQKEIVRQSRLVSDKVRDLQKHVTTEIEMLKELRAATITDAVLGRIDVRAYMKN